MDLEIGKSVASNILPFIKNLKSNIAKEQLLQQTQCTTIREGLEQMLSKELKLTGKYEWEEDEYKATERITALSTVIKMIDDCPPVA